jgi:RNA polymerase sigma-70 factor (ECF subfamily)
VYASILGLLVALHRDEQDAAEVFSTFSEDLWRGLPAFGWQCSFRTWAYVLARNASQRFKKGARRRAGREAPLSEHAVISEVVAAVRTETLTFLRTQKRTQLAALRDALSDDDKTLLILRLDKGLAWNDLARVMLGDGAPVGDAELKREAARLRKRFQLVKDRLVTLARRDGPDEG